MLAALRLHDRMELLGLSSWRSHAVHRSSTGVATSTWYTLSRRRAPAHRKRFVELHLITGAILPVLPAILDQLKAHSTINRCASCPARSLPLLPVHCWLTDIAGMNA